ncbi:MAG: hypothetical protein PVH22_14570, partial [Desulfobacteraceae bacterium]
MTELKQGKPIKGRTVAPAPMLLLYLIVSLAGAVISHAGDPAGLCTELGGHLRAIGTVSYPDHRSIYQWVDNDPFFDRQAELRLKHQL